VFFSLTQLRKRELYSDLKFIIENRKILTAVFRNAFLMFI
jgi:hypothetical protein